jgi:hypothetical protein
MDRSSEIFVCRQVLHRTTCWGEICKAKSTWLTVRGRRKAGIDVTRSQFLCVDGELYDFPQREKGARLHSYTLVR